MNCAIQKCPRAILGLVGFLTLIVALSVSCFYLKNKWLKSNEFNPVESALRCPAVTSTSCISPEVTLGDWTTPIPSEIAVATLGHFQGAKPLLYALNLTFYSNTRFNGTEDIVIDVVETTDVIILNLSPDLQVDWQHIILQQICKPDPICVVKVHVMPNLEVVVLQLSHNLTVGLYILKISNFSGEIVEKSGEGSRGLFLRQTRSSWVVGTLFQMRHARRVFPCFDHPSMKAHLQLCIDHNIDVIVAGNMPTLTKQPDLTAGNDSMISTCFARTPVFPTYVYSMALYQGMNKISMPGSMNPKLSVLIPSDLEWINPDISEWMLPEAQKTIKYMSDLTGMEFPLPELLLVNTPSAPFWGIENAGLVTLDLAMTKIPLYEEAHTILIHEIIHQWLGNVFTIDHWNNICLQEGLTAYMETVLAGKIIDDFHVESKLASVFRGAMKGDEGTNSIIRKYHRTVDIADICFSKPPVIMNMIDKAFNKTCDKLLCVVGPLIKQLVTDYKWNNAGLEEWASALDDVTGDPNSHGVLLSYFTLPGFPVISLNQPSNFTLTISQKLFHNNQVTKAKDDRYFTLPPLEYIDSNATFMTFPALTPDPNITISLPESSSNITWFAVDANSVSYSKILYSGENYLNLLNCFHPENKRDSCDIPENINKFRIFDDFCWGMNFDLFPIANDDSPPDLWRHLLHRLERLSDDSRGQPSLRLRSKYLNCDCCFKLLFNKNQTLADPRYSYFSCEEDNKTCINLKLIQLAR